jgi:L-iditol 2-dehydrogenase
VPRTAPRRSWRRSDSALDDLPTGWRYTRERVEDAIKVVVRARGIERQQAAAE